MHFTSACHKMAKDFHANTLGLFLLLLCVVSLKCGHAQYQYFPSIVDTTFKGNISNARQGIFTTPNAMQYQGLADGLFNEVKRLVKQRDEKILVVTSYPTGTYNGHYIGHVFRLLPDGRTRDFSFTMPNIEGNSSSDNPVINDIVEDQNGKLLAAGKFKIENTSGTQRNLIRLNADGSLDNTFNPRININNTITRVAILTDGKILISGEFTGINSNSRNRIARLNADGSLDNSFNPGTGANQVISDFIVQPDGKILIIGEFTSYNGTSRNYIARLNTDGSLDNSFNPGTGPNLSVYTIALQSDGKILIGGIFWRYNGTSINRIARLNTNGTLDNSFNSGANKGFPNGSVSDIEINSDGNILVGGDFTEYSLVTGLSDFVEIATDGSFIDSYFKTYGTSGRIDVNTILELGDGQLMIGGSFEKYYVNKNGNSYLTNSADLAVFFPDNPSIWVYNGQRPGFNAPVGTIIEQPDLKVLVCARESTQFDKYYDANVKPIVRLNPDGSIDTSFNVSSNITIDYVYSMALQSDGRILIRGRFFRPGFGRQDILRLNSDGTLDNTFNAGSGSDGSISGIRIQTDGKILIFGGFNSYNGVARLNIVRLNTNGSIDNTFNPGSASPNYIQTIAIQTDGKILIGETFNIIRLNSNGTLDNTFNAGSGTNDAINVINIQTDGKILIGGNFTNYNGVSKNRIARLNTNGSLDNSFNSGSGPNGTVLSIIPWRNNSFIIAGLFSRVGTLEASGIYALQATGQSYTFDNVLKNNQSLDKLGYIYPYISTVVVSRSITKDILIGGDFTSVGSGLAFNYARLDSFGILKQNTTYGIANGSNNSIYINDIKVYQDDKILIGGQFTAYNGVTRNNIARLNANGSLDNSFSSGTGSNNEIKSLALQTDGKILVVGLFTTYNGISRNRIARLNTDGSLDNSFNPGTGANNTINTIAIQTDGKILIGGEFTSYNGVARKGFARLNPDGSLDTSFDPARDFVAFPSIKINNIVIDQDSSILVAGNFSVTANNRVYQNLVRLTPSGDIDIHTFAYQAPNPEEILQIELQPDRKIIVLFGPKYSLSGNNIKLWRLNMDGQADTSFTFKDKNTRIYNFKRLQDGSIVYADDYNNYSLKVCSENGGYLGILANMYGSIGSIIQQSTKKVLLGGNMSLINSYPVSGIARLIAPPTLNATINLNPSIICAGSQFRFTLNPQSFWDLDVNSVRVELSSLTGRFNDTVVYNLPVTYDNNARNFICTIPAAIPSGQFYRIRIRASNEILEPYLSAEFGPVQIVNLSVPPASVSVTGNSCLNAQISSGALFTVQNIPGATYSWSNGQTGNPVRINTSGSYNLTISHPACPAPRTHNYNVSVTPIPNCAGVLLIEADAVVNYFDTINVKIRMRGGDNLFSIFAKLQFDTSRLSPISGEVGNMLGSSIINSPAVVTGNSIDFGMTKTSGQPGTNGDGLVYSFKFIVKRFDPLLLYNASNPYSTYTTFKLVSPVINDATGLQRNISLNPLPDTTRIRYYIPVWPGDLNNDRVCNVVDLLRIGIFYNKTGYARQNASLQWLAQPAYLWSPDNRSLGGIPSPASVVFADGNGNGIVDLADQTSIGFNLGRTHLRQIPFFEEPVQLIGNSGVPLTVDITDTLIRRNQLPRTITARIQLGNSGNTYSNLYGLAFDLLFNPAFVDVNNITLNYNNNVFGNLNSDYIKIEDKNLASGKIGIGLTRYNTSELSGFGKVVDVTFPIKQNAPAGFFKVFAVPLAANNKAGASIDISGVNDSVRIEAIISSIKQQSLHEITSIYPNPASSELYISIQSKQTTPLTIEVFDVNGRSMYQNTTQAGKGETMHTVDVSKLAKGMYLLRLTDKEGNTAAKFMVE